MLCSAHVAGSLGGVGLVTLSLHGSDLSCVDSGFVPLVRNFYTSISGKSELSFVLTVVIVDYTQ